MSAPTLNGTTLSHETSFSGFDYPASIQVVPLISDGSSLTGNAVLQQGSMTLRQATLTVVATSPTARATLRTIYENGAAVTYVDHDGGSHTVVVTAFASSVIDSSAAGQAWSIQMTLVETA